MKNTTNLSLVMTRMFLWESLSEQPAAWDEVQECIPLKAHPVDFEGRAN